MLDFRHTIEKDEVIFKAIDQELLRQKKPDRAHRFREYRELSRLGCPGVGPDQ